MLHRGIALGVPLQYSGLRLAACTIVDKHRAAEGPNHRHGRLLPPRRQRPRHRRAAEQGDELAPFHEVTQGQLITNYV